MEYFGEGSSKQGNSKNGYFNKCYLEGGRNGASMELTIVMGTVYILSRIRGHLVMFVVWIRFD